MAPILGGLMKLLLVQESGRAIQNGKCAVTVCRVLVVSVQKFNPKLSELKNARVNHLLTVGKSNVVSVKAE